MTARVDPVAAGIVMVVVLVVVLGAAIVVVVVVVVVVGGIALVDVDVDGGAAGPDVARTASSIPHADAQAITATAAKVKAVRNRDMAFNGTGVKPSRIPRARSGADRHGRRPVCRGPP